MALSRLSLRELQSRPARSLLTLLSIIIGAGAIVATYIASDSAKLAQRAMVQNVTGNAHLEIQAAGGGSFDIREVLFLKELDGIEVISPSVRRYSLLSMLKANPIANIASNSWGSISKRIANCGMSSMSQAKILLVTPHLSQSPMNLRYGAMRDSPNPLDSL
jgi:hypothetical protein